MKLSAKTLFGLAAACLFIVACEPKPDEELSGEARDLYEDYQSFAVDYNEYRSDFNLKHEQCQAKFEAFDEEVGQTQVPQEERAAMEEQISACRTNVQNFRNLAGNMDALQEEFVENKEMLATMTAQLEQGGVNKEEARANLNHLKEYLDKSQENMDEWKSQADDIESKCEDCGNAEA